MRWWIKRALKEAQRSDHERVKIGSVIVDGNLLIATGWNQRKSHPLQAKYNPLRFSQRAVFSHDRCRHWLHAEVHALVRSGNQSVKDCDMFVGRVTKDGRCAISRPCLACSQAIVDAGVARVFYTTNQGVESWTLTE